MEPLLGLAKACFSKFYRRAKNHRGFSPVSVKTSAQQRPVQTTDFEQAIAVNAPADRIFEYLSDVRNVPEYLPTVTHAEPQSGERIRTQGHAGEHEYDSDGHFHLDRQLNRIEWGSDGESEYGGWLQVKGSIALNQP
jgi:uncharacterized membrane protein